MRRCVLSVTLLAFGAGAQTATLTLNNVKVLVPVKEKKSTIKFKLVDAVAIFADRGSLVVQAQPAKPEAGPLADIPYTDISSMSYESTSRRRIEEGLMIPGGSLVGMPAGSGIKTTQHWLSVAYRAGGGCKVLTLHLDKSEFENFLDVAGARTGKKPIERSNEAGVVNPTVGSHNVDQTIPYPVSQVRAAARDALRFYGCDLKKDSQMQVEGLRKWTRLGAFGTNHPTGVGHERIIVHLKPLAENTQVAVETHKGFGGRLRKRNWSQPVFETMLKLLRGESLDPCAATDDEEVGADSVPDPVSRRSHD